MQTKKLSLNEIKGVLSRDEMRDILGGVQAVAQCTVTCNGSAGQWSYSGYPSFTQLASDVAHYCPSMSASVSDGCKAPVQAQTQLQP